LTHDTQLLQNSIPQLKKEPFFSLINIFGLMIGLASFILIALYVFDEYTYDSFHKNADSIYRVVENTTSSEGTDVKIAGAGYQISEKAKADVPGIIDAGRVITFGRVNVSDASKNNVFYEDYSLASSGFLTTFNFELSQGNRETALNDPFSVLITEETALRIFNSTEVLGKLLKIQDEQLFTITGVLKDFPNNSSITYNLLLSESSMTDPNWKRHIENDWASDSFNTYLLLDKNADPKKISAEINQLVSANTSAENISHISYFLQPLKEMHFHSADIEGGLGKKGNIYYIYVFSIIALFVLLIACVNYINLTTARYANRAKEIGMRKVVGATKKSLIAQFLTESYLLSFISLVLALLLAVLLLPYFNDFTGKDLSFGSGTDYRISLGIFFTFLLVGLLSGLYPSFLQSAAKPLSLLQSKINVGKGNLSMRRALVVFQFSLSIIMIAATLVVYQQMNYVSNKNMGFDKERLVVVDINSGKIRQDAETIKSEFSKLAQVKSVSVSSRVPGEWKNLPKIPVKNENIKNPNGEEMYFLGVDDQFLDTYKIELTDGRNFAQGSIADSSMVLLNQTAAKQLGIIEALGQLVEIPLEEPFIARVGGIVKDFNFQSLREPLAPMVLGFTNNSIQAIDYFTVKLTSNQVEGTLGKMKGILQSSDPNHLFEYHFLDKQWELLYKEDKIRKILFFILSILTIIIACLGLLGLVTFEARQRIKEIGVRKVLGADIGNIVALLSKDFLKLIGIAALIAFPITWIVMQKWLQDFAYRIDMSLWFLIIAGVSVLFIALLTVSFQAIKAAMANPVESLRTE
jgi:putative ABC transport system permease protein